MRRTSRVSRCARRRCLLAGCANVAPYQRGYLARESMALDPDPGDGASAREDILGEGSGERRRLGGRRRLWLQLSRDGASPLQALMTAALALPILVAPTRAAAEGNEIGFSVLGYKERGLMKVTEPVLWARGTIAEVWDVEASAAVDIVTGASPRFVSNASGKPVQTITGASINDRRNTSDVKVTRHIGDFSIAASRTLSDEEDYNSKAFGLEAKLDLNEKNTTLVAGYGKSNDRVGSRDDPNLHEPRYTKEYLVGITQVLSPLDLIQSTVSGRAARATTTILTSSRSRSIRTARARRARHAARPSQHGLLAHALSPLFPRRQRLPASSTIATTTMTGASRPTRSRWAGSRRSTIAGKCARAFATTRRTPRTSIRP